MEDLSELHKCYEKNLQIQLNCFDRIILYSTFGNIAYPNVIVWAYCAN